jgi:hypothetical protein
MSGELTDSEKLRILAELFDAADEDDIETVLKTLDWSAHNDGQVQKDLRRIADELEGKPPPPFTWSGL